jgi:hypothetical protein
MANIRRLEHSTSLIWRIFIDPNIRRPTVKGRKFVDLYEIVLFDLT